MHDQPLKPEGAADNAERVGELTAEQLAAAPGYAPRTTLESEIDARFEEWWVEARPPFGFHDEIKRGFVVGFLVGRDSAERKAHSESGPPHEAPRPLVEP